MDGGQVFETPLDSDPLGINESRRIINLGRKGQTREYKNICSGIKQVG